MAKVIMTANDLVNRLKTLAARKTFYKNKYPYNLCYVHSDGRTSADCVNLYKALLNGYDVNNRTVGYCQRNLTNTGDCSEYGLLKQCSDVSGDFSRLKLNEPRLLYMSGHIGGYLGEICMINGKVYNVIECTGSWGGGILYSYVDAAGKRYKYKGGPQNGRWTKHGKMTPWVSYSDQAAPAPKPAQKESEEYSMLPTIKKGSKGNSVKVWQIIIGATPDGVFGPITESNTIKFQKNNGLEIDGIVGPKTWTAGLNSLK